MIRIETTAEFDAEGKFVLTGQSGEPISPGQHRVVVLIGETAEPATPRGPAAEPDSCLYFDGEKLLLDVPLNPDADLSVVHWIEQVRLERERHSLGIEP